MTDLCRERFGEIIKHFERKKKIHSAWRTEYDENHVCIMLDFDAGIQKKFSDELLVLCSIFYESDFVKYKYNRYHIIINYDTNLNNDSYMYFYEKCWSNQEDVIYDLRNRLKYSRFIGKEKSLMAWQVRRKEKDYRTDHFSNTILNLGNTNTYFLIRNGENLFRLISEYHIGEKLFPEKDFFMSKEGESSWDIDNKEEQREQYAFIAIQLQGLLDFSNILDAKIDLLRETENMDYIRNAEPNAISDGHVNWKEYVKKNIASISQGTRIVVKANAKLSSWSYSRNNDNRTAFPSAARPSKNKIYIIEETRTPNGYSIGEFKILVESGDDIYDRYYECHKRKNRVGYWLWNDEVLNIDTITFEDIDYFIRTRFYRSQYNDIIPTMKYVWKILKEEKKQEEPFIKLLMSQTGKEQTECEETLREWKTKNKWKRGVELKTESLAFRMCKRKLIGGKWR